MDRAPTDVSPYFHTLPLPSALPSLASRGDRAATPAHVRKMLAHFHARHIAIGHTLVERVGLGHEGRVLRPDVHHAGGVSQGWLPEDGRLWRVDDAGAQRALGRAGELAPDRRLAASDRHDTLWAGITRVLHMTTLLTPSI